MRATHFGAGNIGRGFIGEILAKNGFSIDFVDINATIIDALNERKEYTIELADENKEQIHVENVDGLNNQTNPEAVVNSVAAADIVTTAIGPNVLPFIAELIAKGIQQRKAENNTAPLDVIACENMIGGSQFLFEKVKEYLTDEDMDYVEAYVGFPNAAVDRIVPIQHHEDPLFVSVEPFSEWVVDQTQCKNKELHLSDVTYVEDLEPYIERKLFSVNTGHATVAYTGANAGYQTIDEAIGHQEVLDQLRAVLAETGSLLIAKWGFDQEQHQAYINKIVGRFENPHISDSIDRVARTPIRKLGYDERFIRPIRELKARGLGYMHLVEVVAMILKYKDPQDEQSVQLQAMLKEQSLEAVITEVTGVDDDTLIAEIVAEYNK
ncbi:mannitol-1-phosphate 5-dehydrogenase [Enterococcus pallens]|uniref:Mannitol-1-phosphate 5-dehydrogenase n=1 Tax=Enterococcus pallens ATCC BAA-351 TaxID=1158607 RepID=R2SRU1_9ENTE|nr:mannitol-1-phosphate 5-dehydrogenase [Enterococcus pallens]EOH97975.1 mannitol-1-phosphate 5-dehydrogenase [Enterococcus pallens ATCC BAA-351]EOU20606.1 mannitol-1-phosphate 5-dehydrogenase [Enterococcus pallens ATCC BAA-351]OJG80368.1 mannitol-1-phosphate 5-dehydrogenase [Enterococcus pallens]